MGRQPEATVFLSYSRKNAERIQAVARRLRAWGYRVWLDQHDISAGDRWRNSVAEAIAGAGHFVLAISRSSLESEVVAWELDLAEAAGTRVIPIVFGSVDRNSAMFQRLDQLHRISFSRGNERGMAELVQALGGVQADLAVLPYAAEFPEINENARMVAEMVRFLQELSKSGGGVVLKGGDRNQYYVQFYVVASRPEVDGEAVGNANLEPADALSQADVQTLTALGWGAPRKESHGNFFRTWFVNSDRGRALLAGEIVRTFLDVYRHPQGERLSYEILAED